jgi:cytoskeletal protein CcmA (bactofilin family)
MFERKELSTTIIGRGVRLEGDFTGEGNVELYGEIRGNVSITGFIKIGPAAKVTANISAESAEVAGHVKGKLTATKDIVLLASADVHGDIKTKQITVTKGARITGRITTDERGASGAVEEPPTPEKKRQL